ncbi:hypothetical protein A8C56_22435 [Niabella ginsenosidivorans]|uniref:Uncharacterized protein n=2 Tax=Niabella ginsenosidivorans TaxID=1176587 RepID=A0A1A9IC43_9BACT|nr:hypothetical protein A8C56_22435 [Niabella ginsenosidivorans]
MYTRLLLLIAGLIAVIDSNAQTTPLLSQYPSPMEESVRRHERVVFDTAKGISFTLNNLLPKPVQVYLPQHLKHSGSAGLLIHFHGNAGIVAYAAEKYKGDLIAVTVNLGTGSGVYAVAFKNDSLLQKLEKAVWDAVARKLGKPLQKGRLILSGFSAGYGAVRSILSSPVYFNRVAAVLLLDGLHTSYIPERKVLAEGGALDTAGLEPFLNFAREAMNPSTGKKFLFTHSEIFPGTFASTTETAAYLLNRLQVKATPVLKWGPGGMQQISEAGKGNFKVFGFAGNSAPDHIDHFSGLYYFLNRLQK